MIRDVESLENWELRIIDGIKNDPNLELALIIKDARLTDNTFNIKKDFISKEIEIRGVLGKKLLQSQMTFEKKRYLNNFQKADKENITEFLISRPMISCMPIRIVMEDIFLPVDIEKIKCSHLDLILKHGFNHLKGDIINLPKYGIWNLSHSDLSAQSGLAGFWEILKKHPVVCATLYRLSVEEKKVIIVDKAYFNRHRFSVIETITKVQESSVSLVMKNLKKLNLSNLQEPKCEIVSIESKGMLSLSDILRYMGQYYKYLFGGMISKILENFGVKKNKWSLFLGEGQFMDLNFSKIYPIHPPKDQFWADPFLFQYKDEWYVFFENFSYKTNRGKVSCGKIENNKMVEIVDVLNLNYHLSYPFIFEEEGEIYLMPESSEKRRLEIYRCVDFPTQWELYTTAFEGEIVQDASFFRDEKGQLWLFINKSMTPYGDRTAELFIYRVDNIRCQNLESHPKNPVLIDCRIARNGGPPFKNINGMFRPSQRNTDGIYGKSLNINRIDQLSMEEYQETSIKNSELHSLNGIDQIHHLHQTTRLFVFDGILV